MDLEVLGPQMALRCEQHFNILRGRIEDRRKVGGCHGDGLEVGRGPRYDLILKLSVNSPFHSRNEAQKFVCDR